MLLLAIGTRGFGEDPQVSIFSVCGRPRDQQNQARAEGRVAIVRPKHTLSAKITVNGPVRKIRPPVGLTGVSCLAGVPMRGCGMLSFSSN